MKLLADISSRKFSGHKEVALYSKWLKGENLQTKILYSAKLLFRIEGVSQKAKAKGAHQHSIGRKC